MTELAKVDAHAARSVAGRIRQGVRDYLATLALVKRAWDEEHWRILGYDSWQDYIDGEFGADRLGLPTEHRDKALTDLRMAGMSVRAIAAATGVPKSTVADEMRRLSDAGQLDQPDAVRSLDGRERPASRPQTPAPMPEPEPEASTSTASGHDHPPRSGEADARLDTAVGPVVSEAPTETPTSVGAGDPLPAHIADQIQQRIAERVRRDSDLDDPEAIAAQQRQLSSENVAKGLVALHFALDADPLRWLTQTWQPDAYRERDLPRVRDAFTASGLRSIAKNLDTLADHLDRTGGSL